jgi:hypothetical protein
VVRERTQRIFLYVKNTSPGDLFVDDAVVKKATPQQALSTKSRLPSAEKVAELDELRRFLRTRRGPHDPPPNPARRAFEAWRHR